MTTTPNQTNHARVHIRDGNRTIEIEGSEEFVKQNIHTILQEIGVTSEADSSSSTQMRLLPDEIIQEDVVIDGNFVETIYEEQPTSPEQIITSMSLLDFFQQRSPQSQRDQVLVIAYFYLKHLKRPDLGLEDYEEAFNLLRRLGVDTPANMKSTVRNVVDRTKPKLLFNPERGRFALTIPGEQLVESMPFDE